MLQDVIALGLCLPASCTTDDLSKILEVTFKERTLLAGHIYWMDFKLLYVKNLRDDYHYWKNWRTIVAGSVLIILNIFLIQSFKFFSLQVVYYLYYFRASHGNYLRSIHSPKTSKGR